MANAIERVLSEPVLDKTMRLFWAKGYAQTPIEEIVTVTGFNRAAIYSRFGGKRGLFLAMLDRYRHRVTARLLDPLRRPEDGLDAIAAFYRQLAETPELAEHSLGCLLVATAADQANLDAPASALVASYLEELTALIRAALENARDQGRLCPAVDAAASADFLAGNVLGLMTLARWPAPSRAFHNQIDEVLRYLHGLEKEQQ
ncbi:TetR/AcrR family transcriptional regulator [Salinisphaera orenii]|uniref:TetR/AcrR family transcriptional regulator n=1 Tax=Salinisphaera orenii TaxID=856731 RepID=UPI000DBE3774